MGFFRSLGRQTERIKQKVTGDTSYRCRACGQEFDDEYDECPHCGADAIEPITDRSG